MKEEARIYSPDMRTASLAVMLCLVLAACKLEHAPSGRLPGPPTAADSLDRIEQDSTLIAGVLAALRAYSARLGARDWSGVRTAFQPGATIATKGTPPGERAERVAIQGVDEFVRRIAENQGRMSIYSERMLHAHVTGYDDVADAWVIREARSGRSRDSVRVQRSVDALHLFRDRGGWRIVSLSTTPESPSHPIVAPQRRPTADRGTRKSSP